MIVEKRQIVNIKGIKDGLLITLGEGEWPELEAALFHTIEERSGFLKGARVALDVGHHVLHVRELSTLRDRLSEKGITVWSILSSSNATEQTAQVLGLATRVSAPKAERTIRSLDTNLPGEAAVLVQRTLRSGFKISYTGHVMVIGDVNPGAEIYAGGSVVVWGRLKGMVHAGMEGDEKAVVCAMEMEPTTLRIAGYTLNMPVKRGKAEAEMVMIQDGRLVAEAWKNKGK
jgi:septum site-determining protein MinC